MPGQFYSDKYIKHRQNAKNAEDNMERAKATAKHLQSEERETKRRHLHEMQEEGCTPAENEKR